MQRDIINEAGKAVVAIPGIVPARAKGMNILLAPEVPKYNIQVYQKMFEKVDLARSIIQRTVEFILSCPQDIRASSTLIQSNTVIPKDVLETISFVRQWIRYKKFKSWLKNALTCTFWAGNSYTEIVPEILGDTQAVGRPIGQAAWKIKELKIIPPDEVRPIRSAFGDLLGYVQYPFRGTYTWLNQGQAKVFMDKGGVFFEPYEIIHMKLDPEPGEAYGTSVLESAKDILAIYVGMREDIAMIIKNYAAPMILFRIGTELIPASAETVLGFKGALQGQMAVSSNIVTSTMVNADVIGAGQKAMNMEQYFQQMLNVMFGSFGVPEIMVGQGNDTTEATGKMQFEAFSRKAKVIQQMMKDEVELSAFSYLAVNKWEHQLMPGDLNKIPELWFGPLETEEDKRIRLENGVRFGMITIQEYRKAYGMKPEPEGDLTPEANLDFQKQIIKYTAQMGKEFAPPQATVGGVPGGTKTKSKPEQKKKDRTDKSSKKSTDKKKTS